MFTELEIERLRLKNIGDDDAAFMYKEFSTDEVNRFLFDAEPIASLAEAKEWIDFYTQAAPRDQHRWIMILKDRNEKIGTCGFHRWNRQDGTVEIGYDLQPLYWKKGYMREALNAMIAYARNEMKVKRIIAHIAENNIASVNTAVRSGFYRTENTYFEDFRGKKYLHYIYQLDL